MTDKVQKIRAFLVGIADADGVSTILARAIEKRILPYIDSLQNEPVSVWHDASEEPKPNMELIVLGEFGNPLVLSSNSDSFKKRTITKWAYFDDLLKLSNVQSSGKEEPAGKVWHDEREKPDGERYVLCYDGRYASVAHYKEVFGCKWAYVDDLLTVSEKERPVSDGFEEEMQYYGCKVWNGDPEDLARHFAAWQKEQIINKACDYLKDNIWRNLYCVNGEAGFPTAEFIKGFRKTMEE